MIRVLHNVFLPQTLFTDSVPQTATGVGDGWVDKPTSDDQHYKHKSKIAILLLEHDRIGRLESK